MLKFCDENLILAKYIKILNLLPKLDNSDKTTQYVSHFGTIKVNTI